MEKVAIGTVVVDPIRGVYGVVEEQKRRMEAGEPVASVGVRVEFSHGEKYATSKLLWYREDRLETVGMYAICMGKPVVRAAKLSRSEHAFDGLPGRFGEAA